MPEIWLSLYWRWHSPLNIERCGKAIMNVDHVPKNLSASLCYFGPGIANFKMLKRQNFPFFGED
jgi:hypothetical protein